MLAKTSKEGINNLYKLAVKYGRWEYGNTPNSAFMKWEAWVVSPPLNAVALRGKVPPHTVSRLPVLFKMMQDLGPGSRLTLSAGNGLGSGRFCKAIILRIK